MNIFDRLRDMVMKLIQFLEENSLLFRYKLKQFNDVQ